MTCRTEYLLEALEALKKLQNPSPDTILNPTVIERLLRQHIYRPLYHAGEVDRTGRIKEDYLNGWVPKGAKQKVQLAVAFALTKFTNHMQATKSPIDSWGAEIAGLNAYINEP